MINFAARITRTATVLGAIAVGAVAFSTSAGAAPLNPFFPFLPLPAPTYEYQPAPTTYSVPQYQYDNEIVEAEKPSRFKRQVVNYDTRETPGTVIVDTPNTYLYYVLGNGRAIRYGIGVGRDGFTWSGVQSVTKKAEWPSWTPPKEMLARQPYLPRFMSGGPGNPLGARAMYLGNTIYRIHGTNAPETIGTQVSSGCIRLTNDDVADLYSRITVGTKVVVKPMTNRNAGLSTGRRG
jgi:lipoprotein-anchoring transpeptidase ErfK/SrfK